MRDTSGATTTTIPPRAASTWRPRIPPALAALGAALAGLAVLVRAPRLLEPDDSAYRASIAALADGHLTLSTRAYVALSHSLGGIQQWVQLRDGQWMSEKNPGYPFLAVAFQLAHAERLTPLFYGAVACVALYLGAARWLGQVGGSVAVLLYVSSGAALAFAWRATMETSTDASLVATGAGLLLWTLLATDASGRRRLVVGLAAFAALDAATATRYTDVTALVVAMVAVLVARRAAGVARRTVAAWLAVALGGVVAILAWNAHFYGGALSTGYLPGQVEFSPSAFVPNLEHLALPLLESMPVALLAVAAVAVIVGRSGDAATRTPERSRDLAVAVGLLCLWASSWALYSLYDWTVQFGGQGGAIHVIRFYVPALGALALLGAAAVVRLPSVARLGVVAALVVAGLLSYQSLVAVAAPSGRLGPNGAPGGPRPAAPTGPPPFAAAARRGP